MMQSNKRLSSLPSSSYDPEKLKHLREVYDQFDQNGDGQISVEELQRCFRIIDQEISTKDAKHLVESFDSNLDGLLDFDDFMRLIQAVDETEQQRNLRKAFEMYEMDGSGYITPQSLKSVLERLGESTTIDDCTVMICRFDQNGDGVLNFEEFVAMIV